MEILSSQNNNQSIDLSSMGGKNEIPPTYYDIGQISGTNIKLGESPIIYPEGENLAASVVIENYKPASKKTPFLEPQNITRIRDNRSQVFNGTRDPREPFNETPESPSGIIEVNVNPVDKSFEVSPKKIKETYKTTTITPYGPLRQSESTLKRENVDSMYNLKTPIISEIGADSTGKTIFTDGESFIEKCVFTGYDKSFIPVKIWKPSQQTRPLDKTLTVYPDENGKIIGRWKDGEVDVSELHDIVGQPMQVNITQPQEVVIPQIFTSKSGYYFTRRPPIKGMFLGYNDADLVPDVATFFENTQVSVDSTRVRPATGPTSYTHNRKIHFFNDRISENILHYPRPFVNWSTSKPRPKGGVLVDVDVYSMTGKEQVMYSKKNTSTGYNQGSYRTLLNSLSKVDIIEYKTVKNRYETIVKPQLKRRIEQYGPNPLQHLFYMDYYDWRKYTTTYIPEDEYMMKIIEPTRELQWSVEKPVDTVLGQNPLSEFRVFFIDNFLNSGDRGRWELSPNQDADGNFFFKDTTYILDIYFGLMEMHLKSFSWQDIMIIVDMIPEFTSPWNDPNWEKLSYREKNQKRFSELDNNLKPIWELIKKALDSVDS